MPETLEQTERSLTDTVATWLAQLTAAVKAESSEMTADLFMPDGYWRDALALTWQLQTIEGSQAIGRTLVESARQVGLTSLEMATGLLAPVRVVRLGREVIEVGFRFETNTGRGRGVVRLVPDPANSHAWQAWTLLTELDELKEYEEAVHERRPMGQANSRDFRGPNWLDKRVARQAYDDRDPTVLVVGGGQAGLSAAARLSHLNVDTLIIDKHERVGDNWRKRYHALTLHNQVQVNHLPYMPFPPNWPAYIPKDKLANWFEAYVESLELNYWTGCELINASFDETERHWLAELRLRDGSTRTMRPTHIVMATGVSGIPNRPELPGLDQFTGEVMHSSAYTDGEDWVGKRAIVIGTGNSAHDISQDLYSSGASVTMVQRSPTLVVSIEPSAQLPYTLYNEGLPTEVCDLLVVGTPLPMVRRAHQHYTAQAKQLDESLLNGLTAVGFKLDFGEDNTGWQFKYLTRGGGYYFNVGCSDLLVDRKVKLVPFDQTAGFTASGLKTNNGETLEADLVVLATGYQPQEVLVERLFGVDVRERVGPIWGYGDSLELRNMYCQTPQPGLWFIAGSLAQCRINSKYLALQIKALEEGLIDS
ncbi:MAG: flavin-containing monooxygenase [Burkholderiaceae bacterium]